MKPQAPNILCGILIIFLPYAGIAQPPAIEFANGSGPAGNGSSLAPQIITFQDNALNPVTGTYTPLTSPITATFTISNQQYTLLPAQNPNGGSISFGASNNTTGKLIAPATLFPAMNYISNAQVPDFSSTPVNINTGMSLTTNYAVEMYTSVMGLYNANAMTNGTYYMANLTITFNVPITNPVIHIVGIGGFSGALGFTTDLTLTTPGLTMTELSGSKELSVAGGGTQIVNTAAAPTATTGAGAASGSVVVNGSSVTSLTFQLTLRGDGKAPVWATANEHVGDAWLIAVSAQNTFDVLPVGITSFTAEPQQRSVDLQWETATEQNSKYFNIERSQDGANWTSIGQVSAAGNSDGLLQYNYVDRQPLTGTDFYRLQEVDQDGSSVYSIIRDVNFTDAAVGINWYPNPTHDRLTISSYSNLQSIALTTLDGRILQKVEGFASGQSLDLSRYPFGIYFLIIRTADGQTRTAKIERN
jgi:hypothetical protein